MTPGAPTTSPPSSSTSWWASPRPTRRRARPTISPVPWPRPSCARRPAPASRRAAGGWPCPRRCANGPAAPMPKRQRRPRRITFRVLFFLVLLGALVCGAWYVIKVYVGDSYFVGTAEGPARHLPGPTRGLSGHRSQDRHPHRGDESPGRPDRGHSGAAGRGAGTDAERGQQLRGQPGGGRVQPPGPAAHLHVTVPRRRRLGSGDPGHDDGGLTWPGGSAGSGVGMVMCFARALPPAQQHPGGEGPPVRQRPQQPGRDRPEVRPAPGGTSRAPTARSWPRRSARPKATVPPGTSGSIPRRVAVLGCGGRRLAVSTATTASKSPTTPIWWLAQQARDLAEGSPHHVGPGHRQHHPDHLDEDAGGGARGPGRPRRGRRGPRSSDGGRIGHVRQPHLRPQSLVSLRTHKTQKAFTAEDIEINLSSASPPSPTWPIRTATSPRFDVQDSGDGGGLRPRAAVDQRLHAL
jgi:hypothetical protein